MPGSRPIAAADNSELERAETALADSEQRYRTLFNSIDEGFCIIEFFDGPHGPLSDYVHIEANPAYALHAGIPDVVGQKLREMVPDEADGWAELYGSVLRTGRTDPLRARTRRHRTLSRTRGVPDRARQPAPGRGAVSGYHLAQEGRRGHAAHERNAGSARGRGHCRTQARRRGLAPVAEDGSRRPAHRRHRARLQQSPDRHHRHAWTCCRSRLRQGRYHRASTAISPPRRARPSAPPPSPIACSPSRGDRRWTPSRPT